MPENPEPPSESAADGQSESAAAGDASPNPQRVVQYCPFCGELVGSFWARRGSDGSRWCEACDEGFIVQPIV